MERDWSPTIGALRAALGEVVRGKEDAVDLLLIGILAGGHVLLEDVPGVGKTTLAKALARVFQVEFSRVQFTPDLLPADILGSPSTRARCDLSKGRLRRPRQSSPRCGIGRA